MSVLPLFGAHLGGQCMQPMDPNSPTGIWYVSTVLFSRRAFLKFVALLICLIKYCKKKERRTLIF